MESSGVDLVLDGEKLLARDYRMTEFRDNIWGARGSATGKARSHAGIILSRSATS
jgi:hypothetical protein